uniref:Global nitrogen transcriptional regulator n=1 Tax=Mastocarpus papillatus TaxID=31436 RepID=A0A342RZC9_9FLOR|nr:global nitrogen transcriptional regulator [Mastocarpus papillatus]AOL58075.1 global nitrogen transcriptional regulator [Mastocarpus papillatus]
MKWINYFTISKIPFYVYKLHKGDSIIYIKRKEKYTSIIVAHGILYLLKIFTNKEILTLGILSKENIVHSLIEQSNSYYKLIAIEESFLISFKWLDLITNKNSSTNLLIDVIKSYQDTLYKYEIMNHILIHKYTEHRIVQLILFLCKEFGLVEQNRIIIPLQISQTTLSIIIGSNRCTISKIIHRLYLKKAISFSKKKYIILINTFQLL